MLTAEIIERLCPPMEQAAADALPPAIQASLSRHRDNLAAMVAALEAIGTTSDAIETHLSIVVDSYRTELSAALHQLGTTA